MISVVIRIHSKLLDISSLSSILELLDNFKVQKNPQSPHGTGIADFTIRSFT